MKNGNQRRAGVNACIRAAKRRAIDNPKFDFEKWLARYLSTGSAKKAPRQRGAHARNEHGLGAELPKIIQEVAKFEAERAGPCPTCRRTAAAMLDAVRVLLASIGPSEIVPSAAAQAENDVLGVISAAGAAGIKLSALGMATRRLTTKDRRAAIAALVKAGRVREQVARGSGRSASVLVAV